MFLLLLPEISEIGRKRSPGRADEPFPGELEFFDWRSLMISTKAAPRFLRSFPCMSSSTYDLEAETEGETIALSMILVKKKALPETGQNPLRIS